MIGAHSVTVFEDRGAAGWAPLASNPLMSTNPVEWGALPFDPAWAWTGSALSRVGGSSLSRVPGSPIVTPVIADTYRVRLVVSVQNPVSIAMGVQLGKSADDAWAGPFWRPGNAVEATGLRNLPVGFTTQEVTVTATDLGVDPAIFKFAAPMLRILGGTGDPGQMVIESFEFDYRGGTSADLSCLVDSVSIAHGRSEPTGQPEPSAATIDLTVTPGNPLPPILDIGAVLTVTTQLGTSSSVRFTGRVTDVSLAWDEAGEDTPDAGVGQVVAVGTLADLARRVVGSAPFPQELDGARVARVAALAGLTLDPTRSDPGVVQITPRDIDSKAALDVMYDAADSASGLVWQTRGGEVRYADADHRRGSTPRLALDACDLLVTPTWTRNLAGLVNAVSIGYGAEPVDGADQPRYVAADAASQTKWGVYGYAVTTDLAALVDATAMGNLLLARNSRPVWNLSSIPVGVRDLTASETEALLGLDMHDLITLTGLPAIGTAPTSFPAWVEGWVERLAFGEHDLQLVVSDYCRTSPPARWDDVAPSVTWGNVDPGRTWNDSVCFGPSTDIGRWDDIPATLRYDTINPASTTWDQWTKTPVGV